MLDEARLVEIYCPLFKSSSGERGKIIFNSGLNTIVGGSKANNSIGKSTLLLIIDYCFGGKTYGESDVKNYVGDHTIYYAFKFRDGIHYFSRTVSDNKCVQPCNSDYEPAGEKISLTKYCELLKAGYEIDLQDTTFRDMVGRYFRIAGKKNDTVINPLSYGSPSGEKAIESLEKLFDLYKFVGALKGKLKEAKDKKTTYTRARSLQLVPNAIKTEKQYQKNATRIEELETELHNLTKDTDNDLLILELQRRDEAAIVESQLKAMKRQYSRLTSKYRVVTKNQDDGFIATENDLQALASFFPEANIPKIEEIEAFHRKLSGILHSEMSEEAHSLQELIKEATLEIQQLEKKLTELGIPLQVPRPFLERFSEIQRHISGLKSQNEAYEKIKEFKLEVTDTEEQLDNAEDQVLRDIEAQLNAQMVRYNDFIYEVQREAPTIRFESKAKYDFHTPRDGGTGTAYKSLVVLDMSILKLTQLPAISHDSSIFKNIGDEPIDKLMELYLQSNKQVFIAFDKEEAYTDRTAEIVKQTEVIRLGEDGDQLFGWTWATK